MFFSCGFGIKKYKNADNLTLCKFITSLVMFFKREAPASAILKHNLISFRMFLLLLLTMTLCWLFFLASFSKYDGLINAHIIVNAFQGPIIFYVCILNQKHVAYLIQKTCCYKTGLCPCVKNDPEAEWGDEMTAMNTGNY